MDLRTSLKTTLRRKYQKLKEAYADKRLLPLSLCNWDANVDLPFPNLRQHEFRIVDKSDLHTWVVRSSVFLRQFFSCDCQHLSCQRTVLTYGVSGAGKTTVVQTCALDWAEGQEYQNIDLLFPLTFWELNSIKCKVSFLELLRMFYPEMKELDVSSLKGKNVWFVLDGLDECNMPLDFHSPAVSDVSEVSKVDTLVTSLIRGSLLPRAHVWITTRFSAATRIPDCYILTENKVQGFNDNQKEDHFRNIILDDDLASRALDHVKISRSLNHLSEIPPICTVMANILKSHVEAADDDFKIRPLNLTEMYSNLIQDSKFGIIGRLKELALLRLSDNSVMYESDLAKKDISVREASAFSKKFPLVLREEKGLHNTTVFRFGQSSIQEFLAASATLDKMQGSNTASAQLQDLVDAAERSPDGEFDGILRFTFGLLKKRDTLPPTDPLFDYTKKVILHEIVTYKSVILFHALREYDSQALLNEVKFFLKFGFSPIQGFTPVHWTFMIQRATNFEAILDNIEMPVGKRCDELLRKTLPALLKSKTVGLGFSNLTDKSCPILAAVLSTGESYLRVLDLGFNSFTDHGIKSLVEALSDPNCRLKKLRLPGCRVSSLGCKYLIKALKESPKLIELDLSRNDIGNEGVRHLANGLKSPECRLEVLRLSQCRIESAGCSYLASALQANPSHLKGLDLSINSFGDKGANELLKKVDITRLLKLELYHCGLTMLSCVKIGEALKNESSVLVELNLSSNNLKDAGLELICEGMYAWCSLEKLNVSRCGISNTGCHHMFKVLGSVSQLYQGWSQRSEWQAVELKELDISRNCLLDQGVKEIVGGLKNPYSHLKVLNLCHCSLTDECCLDLGLALASKQNVVTELNLTGNEIQDKGLKKFCMGLKSPLCKLEKLILRSCNLTSKSIQFLTTALKSNPQHLTELLLMGNNLEDSSIRVLCELTKNQKYALQTLDVSVD
ncbi:NACHT%2C LRR and PYD domains-containing protein 12-like [Xyrichtys novacula]|uniref:NACHT, LRR and PYD domains-containing protein 12-like n=1 Tax=Xyrichtys novacula TaxID=13765 RepID=A0AAV1EX19_XYRNO|nr:NACHT%2C LRR and PYD domains-containing protein 12-like [Xyrichtys novacula]